MIPDRLDRHVAAAVLRSSLLVAAVFVALDWLLALLDQIDDRTTGYGLPAIAEHILLTTPRRFWDVVPYVALLGALFGLSGLGARGELVVMRAAGRRLERIVVGALLAAGVLVAVGALSGEWIGPRAEARAQLLKAQALDGGQIRLHGGSWYQDPGLLTHARAVDAGRGLIGVTQYAVADDGSVARILRAARADWQAVDGAGRQQWRLFDVDEIEIGPRGVRHRHLASSDWRSGADIRRFRLDALVPPERMPLADLLLRLETPGAAAADRARLQLALWRKLAQPLAILALVLVGAGFVFGPLRERSMGLRLAAGIATGIGFRYAQDLLAPASLVFGFPPWVAVLLPVVLALVAGLLLMRRAA